MVIFYFVGTRAHTDLKTEYHRRNVSTILAGSKTVMIDVGEGLKKDDVEGIYKPDFILISHAHEDHAGPVLEEMDQLIYTIPEIAEIISKRLNLGNRLKILTPCQINEVEGLKIMPIKTVLSMKAPAVGYYIELDGYKIFVAHDFFSFMSPNVIPEVDIWIGDGQSPFKRLIRAANLKKVSHASIMDQVELARTRGVKLFIVTHVGKETMEIGEDEVEKRVSQTFPDLKFIIARDNSQINTDEQFIKDPSNYNPEKVSDEVLRDDWRWVNAWYANMKDKDLNTIAGLNKDELIDLATQIYIEMLRRGMQFHPENWKEHTKELVREIRRRLPKEVKEKLDQFTSSEILKLVGEASENKRLYLPEVVGMFSSVEEPEFSVYLIGGLVNRGWTDNDIDILVLSKYRLPIIEELIKSALPPALRSRVHIVYRDPSLPLDYLGNYVPLFKIALLKNSIEVRYSELDEIKPFDRFVPMKSAKGYHAAEYYDPVELYEYWAKPFLEEGRPLVVQPKYDGIRGIVEKKGNRVEIFTEDTRQDISWRLPTLVEQLKKIPGSFILDGELVEWEPNFKRPRPREDMTWMATSKEVLKEREKWVRYNVFDVLYWRGKDITALPYSERLKYLEKIPNSKNIRKSPSKIVKNKSELWKAIAWAKDKFPESEGAMLKVLDSPYLVGKKSVKRTPLWCLHPDSLVLTERGFMKVSDIIPGDKVFSSDGQLHEVKGVFRRPLEEKLWIQIQPYGGLPFKVSPDHLLLVWDEESKMPYWKEARTIRKDDKLVFVIPDVKKIEAEPPQILNLRYHGYEKNVVVTPEFYYFLGRWLASGFIDKEHGIISLELDVEEDVDRWISLIQVLFSTFPTIQITPERYILQFKDKPLADWLIYNFVIEEDGALIYRLPLWLLKIGRDEFKQFVRAYWEHFHDKWDLSLSAYTKSYYLAGQLLILGLVRGPTILEEYQDYFVVRFWSDKLDYSNPYILVPIEFIEHISTEQLEWAYDLEIEGSDNYLGPLVVYHNSKWKRALEIDVKVLEVHEVKKNGKPTGTYNYIVGLAIPKKRLDILDPKDIVEFKGKKYYKIGRTYNTKIEAKPGDILTIIPVYISVKKMRNGKLRIRWMNPSVEHKKLGKKEPDDVDFAISKATLVEGLGDNETLDDIMLSEGIEVVQPWVIEKLPPCPYYGTEECVLLHPDKLARLVEELELYHICPYAKSYRCPLVKDYFYRMKMVKDDG